MKLHRFEKLWIAIALLLIVGFIATVTYGAVGAGVEMMGDEGGTIDTPKQPAQDDDFREPGVYKTGENSYDVYIVARQFFFNPGTQQPIRLPAGSTVTLYVTSGDVVHGFEVAGTNVNTMAIPGQVSKMTVEFDKPGEYGIVCNEYCGNGHHTMEGQIIIVPQDEYEGGN